MKNLVNHTGIQTVSLLSKWGPGRYRFITKCRAGYLIISDADSYQSQRYTQYPEELLSSYKKGRLQTIEFQPEGTGTWLTVFARQGKRIHLIDETILASLTVGTINQLYHNTELYNQNQYQAVGAKTWADLAYAVNQ